ncbi:hypothetical protein T492DRAFT_857704, partial [Pavlovales sp. CCMP2436]
MSGNKDADAQNRAFEWAMKNPAEAQKAAKAAGKAADAVDSAGGLKVLAGAAVVGAGIAALATGSILIGLVGEVAREAGGAANAVFDKAKEVNREHKVVEKAKAIG